MNECHVLYGDAGLLELAVAVYYRLLMLSKKEASDYIRMGMEGRRRIIP